MSFQITVNQKEKGTYIIKPVGDIDTNTYRDFESKVDSISNLSPKVIIFDMEYVTFISSLGVGVILKAKKMQRDNNGTIVMVNLKPQIKTVFDIIKALPNEEIFSNMEELDNYLKAIQQKDTE